MALTSTTYEEVPILVVDENGIEREQDIRVYTVPLRSILQLRSLASRLGNGLMGLFSGNAKDMAGRTVRNQIDPAGEKGSIEEITNPVSLAVWQQLQEKKTEGLEEIIRIFLEEQNLEVVCSLIADCCRDNDEITAAALMDGSADIVTQLFAGFIAANQRAFDPLLKSLQQTTQEEQETPTSAEG